MRVCVCWWLVQKSLHSHRRTCVTCSCSTSPHTHTHIFYFNLFNKRKLAAFFALALVAITIASFASFNLAHVSIQRHTGIQGYIDIIDILRAGRHKHNGRVGQDETICKQFLPLHDRNTQNILWAGKSDKRTERQPHSYGHVRL